MHISLPTLGLSAEMYKANIGKNDEY